MIISFDCKDDDLYEAISSMDYEDKDFALTAFMQAGFSGFLVYLEEHPYDRTFKGSHQI